MFADTSIRMSEGKQSKVIQAGPSKFQPNARIVMFPITYPVVSRNQVSSEHPSKHAKQREESEGMSSQTVSGSGCWSP
jgi:hypothetical protein